MRLGDLDALMHRFMDKPPDYYHTSYIVGEINTTPTVDVVPVVRGRWVKMTGMMPPEYHGHYECSECQWHMKGLRNSWTREEELSYCPNCGAKMDLEDKDNVGRPISSL
jgi:DNA-directed RNA polymerase subunit RPC12/RpoP